MLPVGLIKIALKRRKARHEKICRSDDRRGRSRNNCCDFRRIRGARRQCRAPPIGTSARQRDRGPRQLRSWLAPRPMGTMQSRLRAWLVPQPVGTMQGRSLSTGVRRGGLGRPFCLLGVPCHSVAFPLQTKRSFKPHMAARRARTVFPIGGNRFVVFGFSGGRRY
jgi:hypothetical protein